MSTSSASLPAKMRAANITEQGDFDVIQVRDLDVPKPAQGQLLYKVEWGGVNMWDTYARSGVYKPGIPFTLGNESAGEVVAVGEGVEGFKAGDKVAVSASVFPSGSGRNETSPPLGYH